MQVESMKIYLILSLLSFVSLNQMDELLQNS